MPQYEAELSDGRVVTVESDNPPTEDQIISAIGGQQRPAVAALNPQGLPRFTPTRELAPPPEGEEQIIQSQRNTLTALTTAGRTATGGLADIGNLLTGQSYEGNIHAGLTGEEMPAEEVLKNAPLALRVPGRAAQGLIETTPKLAAVVGLESIGIPAPVAAGAIFGVNQKGEFVPQDAAVAAALPFAGKYSGEIVGAIAKKLGVTSADALRIYKAAGGTAGASAYLATIQESEIENLPPEQRKDARIEAIAQNLGQAGLGALGVAENKSRSSLEFPTRKTPEKVIAVAFQDRDTGKIFPGNPGELHPDLAERIGVHEGKYEDGFISNTGRFLTRDQAAELSHFMEGRVMLQIQNWASSGRRDKLVDWFENQGSKLSEAEELADRAISQYGNPQEKGQQNAKTIRGYTGQLPETGQEPQRSGEIGGNDIQQPPSWTPNAPGQVEAPPNVPNETLVKPESIANEMGWIFKKTDAPGIGTAGMAPELAAKMEAAFKPQWQFTDPESAATFHVPEGSTREQILKARDATVKAFGGPLPGEPGYITPERKLALNQTPFSMGGLAPDDPIEVAGKGGGDPNIYGIAERVRAERAAGGQVAEVPPGVGITAEESVNLGRKLLAADPSAADKALTAFEADKKISGEGIALVRAKGEELAKKAVQTESKFGTGSDEYKAAFKELSDWDTRTKAMQTEWHRAGQAQQGETDIDTGSFTGLQREFKKQTGKEFKPEQAKGAKEKAKKVADAEKTTLVAKEKLTTAIQDTAKSPTQLKLDEQSKAARDALAAAHKTVREAAARNAETENKARVADEKLRQAVRNIQDDAAVKAAKAANKTITEDEIRKAREENKARVKAAAKEKLAAQKEAKEAQRKMIEATAEARRAAIEAARQESVNRANPERVVWKKAKEYLDQGIDNFDDIRHKIATDLGMSVDKVTELMGRSPRAKFLTNDLWRKQQTERRLRQQAKSWLTNLEVPGYQKALANIPKILFGLKVGFHGTVALGTHAPMVAFQPKFWNTYIRDFGKMYRMVGSKVYYERQVQDLVRRPNYITARRAGLVNDPSSFEDFNSPDTAKYFGNLTGMGNRGYSVLKILRQDMFDQMWDQLPRTAKAPDVAEAIADGINHATGVVKASAPKIANLALFAPRLLGSRAMWLAVDPVKAVDIFARWRDASPGEKRFAINQVQEKAWVLGTLFGLLAINQGFLSATGSKQKINIDDPFKSDWLKFKAAGMVGSYGNAMLTMARLPIRLYKIRSSDGGKLKNVVYPDEDTYSVLGEYARSQMSPFASLAADLWLKQDWQRRQLPNSNRPMPKRLREKGEIPYTWPEFWAEQMLPIPAEEAAREVWKHGLGASDDQIKAYRKALATIAVMGATGARLTEDTDVKQ